MSEKQDGAGKSVYAGSLSERSLPLLDEWMRAACEGDLAALGALALGWREKTAPRRVSGIDPLMAACMSGRSEAALLLIKAKPSWVKRHKHDVKRTSMHWAAAKCSTEVLDALDKIAPENRRAKDEFGDEPELAAAYSGVAGNLAWFLEKRRNEAPDRELDCKSFARACAGAKSVDEARALEHLWDMSVTTPGASALEGLLRGPGDNQGLLLYGARRMRLWAKGDAERSRIFKRQALVAMGQGASRGWPEAVATLWSEAGCSSQKDLDWVLKYFMSGKGKGGEAFASMVRARAEKKGLAKIVGKSPSAKGAPGRRL